MALGYAPYLLKTLSEFAGVDDPEYKLTPTGFLKMLLASNAIRGINVLKTNTPQGQIRQVQVKYRQRATMGVIKESDDCDIDLVQPYLESTLVAPRIAKVGIYVSYDELRRYVEDAIRQESLGQPATTLMKEHVDRIMSAANAILGFIDTKLLNDVDWGVNKTTGSTAKKFVNLNKDATVNGLNQGLAELLNDAFENEMWGSLQIVGSGLFNNFQISKVAAVAALNGIDVSKFTGYNWFPDLYTSGTWGTNHIGIFSQGAIGFADIDKFLPPFAGQLGVSTLFRASLPVMGNQNDGTVNGMTFDMQLKPIDCPTVLLNGYGEETTYDKGFALFITKNYGLWQVPTDAYSSLDRLAGVNGSLQYEVTNDCSSC